MTTIDTSTSVYVGTYNKYDNGSLFGEWLNLEDYSDKDEFIEACKALHSDENDPEFMFQDWEGLLSNLITESSVPDEIFEFYALEKYEQLQAYAHLEATGYDLSYSLRHYEDVKIIECEYEYEMKDLVVDDWLESLGAKIPSYLENYIDYDAVYRDIGYEWTFVSGVGAVYVYN